MQVKNWLYSCFCILFLHSAFGQTDTLKTVPVYARPDTILRIAVLTSAIPHFELSSKKMDELGVKDVGEALKYIPGVQLKDYGGIGGLKTVSFRSLGATHTVVEVDGNQVPNVQSGVVNLSAFELFGLESVSFSSGQSTDQQATAGAYVAANTISLRSILAQKPKGFRMGLYSNSTTINAFEKGAYAQGLMGKKWFVGGQGMTRFGSGAYPYLIPNQGDDEELVRQNARLFNYRLRGVAGMATDRQQLTISAYYFNNEQQLPGAAVLFNPSNDQTLWNEDWRLAVNHFAKTEKWTWQGHLNYQQAYTRYYDPHFLNLDGFIDVDFKQQVGTGGLVFTRPFKRKSEYFRVGFDGLLAGLESNNLNANPERWQGVAMAGAAKWWGRIRTEANLTLQYITDHFDGTQDQSTKTFVKWSPFVAVAIVPFEQHAFKVRGFFKRAFRMPTLNDLYYNFIGNTNLRPEDAYLTNLGLTYGFKKGKLAFETSVDAYYNQVTDKIVAIPTKDLFNWSMQNIGRTEIMGTDIGLLVHFKKGNWSITGNTSQSFNTSLDRTDPGGITYGHQIPYTPYYTGTYGVAAEWKTWGANANLLYNGLRYSLNENIITNYLPPFTDMNCGVSKTIMFKTSALKIDVKAMNIFNKNYQVIRSFPMPGRYYQLQLKYNLSS